MSTSIVVPYTNTKPAVLVSQQLGAFIIQPQTESQVRVESTRGVLVNGLLYKFSGYAVQHSEGDWRFWAGTLDGLKGVPPKVKADVLAKMTVEVNAYMKDNPDIMKVLVVRSWEQTKEQIERSIRDTQSSLIRNQNYIEQQQASLQAETLRLREMQQKLTEHLANRPEEAKPTPDDVESEVV